MAAIQQKLFVQNLAVTTPNLSITWPKWRPPVIFCFLCDNAMANGVEGSGASEVRLGYTPEPLLLVEVVVVEAVSMPGRSNDPALRHNPPRRVTRAAEQSRGSRGPRSVLRCVTVRPGPPQPGGTEPALATASNTAASYSTLGGSLVSLASAAQQLQVWSL